MKAVFTNKSCQFRLTTVLVVIFARIYETLLRCIFFRNFFHFVTKCDQLWIKWHIIAPLWFLLMILAHVVHVVDSDQYCVRFLIGGECNNIFHLLLKSLPYRFTCKTPLSSVLSLKNWRWALNTCINTFDPKGFEGVISVNNKLLQV